MEPFDGFSSCRVVSLGDTSLIWLFHAGEQRAKICYSDNRVYRPTFLAIIVAVVITLITPKGSTMCIHPKHQLNASFTDCSQNSAIAHK